MTAATAVSPGGRALQHLARLTACHLRSATHADAEEAALADAFAAELEALDVAALPAGRPTGREVRGLRFAPAALAAPVPAQLAELRDAAAVAFAFVNWTEFYDEDAWSRPFLDRFANGEAVGPDGIAVSNKLILGLFLLGPEAHYPAHAHPAEEFYLVLSGSPEFQVGVGEDFLPRPPGTVVLHRSEQSHAIRTRSDVFWAIFGWRGDLRAPSWYREDMTDPASPLRRPLIRKD